MEELSFLSLGFLKNWFTTSLDRLRNLSKKKIVRGCPHFTPTITITLQGIKDCPKLSYLRRSRRCRKDTLSKNGCLRTVSSPILSAGSYISIDWIRSNSCSWSSPSPCWYFFSSLQFSLTYFPAELCSSHTNLPVLKYFVFVRRVIDAGKGPRIFSIIARCSLLSWVWNKVNPRYSSNMMHPMLHTSHGWDHPNSKMTSGAL